MEETPSPKPAKTIAFNLFLGVAISLLVVGVVAGYFTGTYFTPAQGDGGDTTNNDVPPYVMPSEELKPLVQEYLNQLITEDGVTVKMTAVEEDVGNLYKLGYDIYEGDELVYSGFVHATKDGAYILLGNYNFMDLAEPIDESEPPQQVGEIQTSEVPDVKVFVMSFCQFGQDFMNVFIPVAKLFGDSISAEVYFITSSTEYYAGYEDQYCMNDYCSMHGINELNENIRQKCVYKHEKEKFWDYVEYINTNCSQEDIETCWLEGAEATEADTDAVKACFADEAAELLAADRTEVNKYDAGGSPTFVINDSVIVSRIEYCPAEGIDCVVLPDFQRTPESIKEIVCSAFDTPPEECSEILANSGSSNGGQC